MKNFKGIVSVLFISILATACGNQVSRPDPRFLASGDVAPSSGSALPPSMQCSENPNITLSSGLGGNEFRACVGSEVGSVRIYPTQSTESVCVFPALAGRALASISGFLVQCGTLGTTGGTLTFSGANFDSVYIVSSNNGSAMARALYSGNPEAYASQYGFSFAYGRL